MGGATNIASLVGVTAGADVTPDPITWPNCSGSIVASPPAQEITGINTPISLKITWTGGAAVTGSASSGGSTNTNGGSFIANNLDSIHFIIVGAGTSGTVTITNQSDGNTVIGTFTYVIYSLFI